MQALQCVGCVLGMGLHTCSRVVSSAILLSIAAFLSSNSFYRNVGLKYVTYSCSWMTAASASSDEYRWPMSVCVVLIFKKGQNIT